MDQKVVDLTMLLIYLTCWEETPRNGKPGEFRLKGWKFFRFEIMGALQDRGLIRMTPGGSSLTVTEKGKQAGEELKKKVMDKTNDQFLKELEKNPWTKSFLPCHVMGDDKKYDQYLELMDLMRMPEIETIILGKLADLKIVAKSAVDKFFKDLDGTK
jgi:hypothetical protein